MFHRHAFGDPEHRRASEIGFFDDDALGQNHARVGFLAVHRVLDQRRGEFHDVPRLHSRVDPVQFDVVRHRERTPDIRPRPREYTPGASDTAADQRADGVALPGVGSLVDENHRVAVTKGNRSGPLGIHGKIQSIQRHTVGRSVFDVPGPAALTLAVSWQRVEVAGAAVIAIARDEHRALEVPRRLPIVHYAFLSPGSDPSGSRVVPEGSDPHYSGRALTWN